MRSDRSTVRTCSLRVAEASAAFSSSAMATRRARRIAHGLFLVLQLRLLVLARHDHACGTWVMRTAESVVFTLWPPGPGTGRRRCAGRSGSMVISTSSVSNTGTPPPTCDAPLGLRDRHPLRGARLPTSAGRKASRHLGLTFGLDRDRGVLHPAGLVSSRSMTSMRQPRIVAYRSYMRNRSPANNADSSPPSPL